MAEAVEPKPVLWRGVRVGTVEELSSDMYWWHARWTPSAAPEAEALLEQAEEGEEPEVLVGEGDSALRLRVTAGTRQELELKNAL